MDQPPPRRLCVSLKGVTIEVDAQSETTCLTDGIAHFQFDLRDDAETFKVYVRNMQERLMEYFVQSPFYTDKLVYSWYATHTPSHVCEMKRLWFPAGTSAVFHIIFRNSCPTTGETSKVSISAYCYDEDKVRMLITQEACSRSICCDFGGALFEVTRKESMGALYRTNIWEKYEDTKGNPTVRLTNWAKLLDHGRKINDLGSEQDGAFVSRSHERTAEVWQQEVDDLIDTMRADDTKRSTPRKVKIAIIDSGLHPRDRAGPSVKEYRDFINENSGGMCDNTWHGTCSAKIILDMYEEAELYIARIFERNEADERQGPLLMAKAIDWAIEEPRSVDIISISAGFSDYSPALQSAVIKASAEGVLIFAAASNWGNLKRVAYPARHSLNTICVFSTNPLNKPSEFNPEPRDDAVNFAILGEKFRHPDPKHKGGGFMNGTSMATAVAAGLAARILDFSRQPDNWPRIHRVDDVGKMAGMMAIFKSISNPSGKFMCLAPLEMLTHKEDRESAREEVRYNISKAMRNAN